MSSKLLLSIKKIYHKYPNNEDFRLDMQEMFYTFDQPLGIYGLSGSGKSTFGKIIAGLLVPLIGEIELRWLEKENCEHKKTPDVMYSTQFPEKIFLGSKVKDTVELILSKNPDLKGMKLNLINFLSKFSVDYVNIEHKSGYELSGGELRRFALSLSMACSPDLLILDEPTIGFGGRGKQQLRNIAEEFQKEHALIVVSHDFRLIENICDYLWVLDKGKIVFNGNFAELERDFYKKNRGYLSCDMMLEKEVVEKKSEI